MPDVLRELHKTARLATIDALGELFIACELGLRKGMLIGLVRNSTSSSEGVQIRNSLATAGGALGPPFLLTTGFSERSDRTTLGSSWCF